MNPISKSHAGSAVLERPCPEATSLHSLSLSLYRPALAGKVCGRVTQAARAELPALIARMVDVCREHDGVGLAAPQLGVDLQLAVVVHPVTVVTVLVNPEIENLAGRDLLEVEGCLSLPGEDTTARIWRSEVATVRSGTLEDPEARVQRTWKGTMARIVQHEIDHLRGVFFIDRCQGPARLIVLGRYGRYLRKLRGEIDELL